MMAGRFLCLILLKSEGVSAAHTSRESSSSLEGYTLVNTLMREQFPLSMISASTPIVSHEKVNPAPNSEFDLVEVWQDHTNIKDIAAAIKRKKLCLYVNAYNLDVVRRLFPVEFNIQFVTKFRIDEKFVTYKNLAALDEENLTIIRKLLECGAKFRWRRAQGGTTLAHFAVEKGFAALLALLGEFRVDPHVGLNESAELLHIAIKKRDLESVKMLLDNDADIDGRTADGSSALHLATKEGLREVVQLLLEKGASVEAKTAKGWTSLHFAASIGDDVLSSLLLEHGANLESTIDRGTDAGATPLHIAMKKMYWKVARQLVENGASLIAECANGRNALYFAIEAENDSFVKFLLDRHLDLTSPGNREAFHLAFQNYYSYALHEMMTHGFYVDAADLAEPDVLFGAIQRNLIELVKQLLENGANVHQEHLFLNRTTTPIHIACRCANEAMVQLLLDYGANPSALAGTDRLNTPIANAVESKNAETVKLLLANNVSVQGRTDFLLSAAENNCPEIVTLLLENGANVNSRGNYKDITNKTAVFFAARRGRLEIVDTFMKYGATFDFKDVSEELKFFDLDWVTPESLKAFLAYGFTTDLDVAAAAHLCELLTTYDTAPNEAHYEWYYSSRKMKCATVIAQHVMKMEAAGMKVAGGSCAVVPTRLFEIFSLNEFQKECEKEVDSMKTRKIANTGVCFFDLLTKTSNRAARYTRNENIRIELNNCAFETEYPHYGNILHCQYQRSNLRRELIDTGIKLLGSLNWRFRALPFDLKEDVVGFLNNQDLMTLQKCVQTPIVVPAADS